MEEILDISIPVSPLGVVWPGAPKTEFSLRRSMEKGDRSNNTNLFMNCHTGTHIDAPLHFVKEGKTVEKLSLDLLVGRTLVIDLSHTNEIDVSELEKFWPNENVRRLLLKTPNSKIWETSPQDFEEGFCALREREARWILDKGVELVGIDYLSIQKYGDPPIVHQLLLKADVLIVEGLNLSRVSPGFYQLICLPLKLIGTEAAPARAILKRCQIPDARSEMERNE